MEIKRPPCVLKHSHTFTLFEPCTFLSALAMVTSRIGLVATTPFAKNGWSSTLQVVRPLRPQIFPGRCLLAGSCLQKSRSAVRDRDGWIARAKNARVLRCGPSRFLQSGHTDTVRCAH
ncbi:MAG: hypothetical protein EOO77_41110 [Oxalobacteraceae bacterium]|nr:MAG: hypothetical protein EOO77_41110 [Oxalobacteraceae bacterium]